MKLTGRKIWAIVLSAVACALIGIGFWQRSVERRQAAADFAWFSGLGFPDPSGLAPVRVATSWQTQTEGDPPQNVYLPGFLLATNRNTFTVMGLDLMVHTWSNTPAGTPEPLRVGFEMLDLHQEAAAQLRQPLGDWPDQRSRWWYPSGHADHRTKLFILAWGCWENGLQNEALRLYKQAGRPSAAGSQSKTSLRERINILLAAIKDKWRMLKNRTKAPSLREEIERNLSGVLLWRATAAFGDPSVTRSNLLSQFEAIVRNYPGGPHRTNALNMARMLEQMIAEDATHAEMHSKPLAQLTVEEQLRELIFHLRDQYITPIPQQWTCDCLRSWCGTTNNPEASLRQLGYAAVPQLIAAVDSKLPSRVWGGDDYRGEFELLTVGDCAQAVLSHIAGRSFRYLQFTRANISNKGSLSPARSVIENWWAEFQQKGEKRMLLEGVARADLDSARQAALLRERYPEISTDALIHGTQTATNADIRRQLIEQIAEIGDAPGLAFLKKEMAEDPDLLARVKAAHGLTVRFPVDSLRAMIEDWKEFSDAHDDDYDNWESLVEFLARRDSVEAISALTNGLSKRQVEIRYEVVNALGDPDYSRFGPPLPTPSQSGPTLDAMEAALVKALDDPERNYGSSTYWGNANAADPRVCDIAGHCLTQRWPKRYTFDVSASLGSRDRQRLHCINAWRAAHGLTSVPLPQPPSVRVTASDAAKITAIEWAKDGAQPDNSFLARLKLFKEKSLRAKDLARLLTDYALHPERGSAGLELNASKDTDLTGVRLLIRLIPGATPPAERDWDTNEFVTLGRKQLHSQSSSFSRDPPDTISEWNDLAAAIKEATAGPPETPFEINVRLIGSKNQ